MPIATAPNGDTVYLDNNGQWLPAQLAENPQTGERMAFDGRDWQSLPRETRPIDRAASFFSNAVNSIPIAGPAIRGGTERTAAQIRSLVSGKSYEDELKFLQDYQRRATEQHPGFGTAGNITGAVAGTVPMVAAAPAAFGVGATSLPAAVGLSAVSNAVIGGADEAVRSGGDLSKTGRGALWSLLFGGAAPVVGRALGGTYNAVRGAISPQNSAAADIARAIVRDDTTPAALAQRAQELAQTRPGVAALVDAGGENVRGLAERIAQTPGAGRTQVVPALTARQEAQGGRFAGDLRELTGTSRTAMQAIDETIAERAAAARPLYSEAFDFNARQAPEIVTAWQKETGQGWGRSILNSADMRKTLQTEYGIRDAADAPLMVQIDAWQKLVRDKARDAAGTNLGRVLGDMRDRVLSVVDNANPSYGQARSAWAGPSQYRDAINEGRNILSKTQSAEEMAAQFRAMSDSQREGYRIGAVSALIAKMGSDPAKLGDMTKYLRSPQMREKIAAMMPTPEAAEAWARRLNFEIGTSEVTGRSLGNSATARRLAERDDAQALVGDLVMDAITGTPAISWFKRIATSAPAWLRDTLRSRTDRELGSILTDPRRMDDLPDILVRLRQAHDRQRASGAVPAALGLSGGLLTD